MRQCSTCGYHMTRMLGVPSCDACKGAVPKPIRWKGPSSHRERVEMRDDPTGLEGEDLCNWLKAHPDKIVRVGDGSRRVEYDSISRWFRRISDVGGWEKCYRSTIANSGRCVGRY